MKQPSFQFSTRDLLIATTLVSIVLAIGVPFGGFALVATVIGLIQVTMLLAGDWLIRPENRCALAFATAGSWATLGSGLLVLSIHAMFQAGDATDAAALWALGACLAFGAAASYSIAVFRWRHLTTERRGDS